MVRAARALFWKSFAAELLALGVHTLRRMLRLEWRRLHLSAFYTLTTRLNT
jgi:hypothetical protein